MIQRLIEDPFCIQRLNPVFLQEVRHCWKGLRSVAGLEGNHDALQKASRTLVKFTFRRLFQPLYLAYSPKISGPVYFVSCIHSDGLGDFFSLLKSARALKLSHPNLHIHIAYTHKQQLPVINFSTYLLDESHVHSFLERTPPNSGLLESILEGKSIPSHEPELAALHAEKRDFEEMLKRSSHLQAVVEDLEKQIQSMAAWETARIRAESLYRDMQKSIAIVHIALALNTFDNPLLAAKSLYFAETGNFQGIANFLQRNWFSMGLLPFEEGIFIKGTPTTESRPWEDCRLPNLLWQNSQPSGSDHNEYFRTHSLHLGYLPKISQQQIIFVYLICLQRRKDMRQLDIILPHRLKISPSEFNWEWLSSFGINRVVCSDLQVGTQECLFHNQASAGKCLRLIYALPIPPEDFSQILMLCEGLVGCTGDASLSECLIADKIPFYEMRQHKVETIESLQRLSLFLNLSGVHNYFTTLAGYHGHSAESVAGALHTILQRPSFQLQWSLLLAFIRKHYCFEDALQSHLNRHFFHHIDPSLKEKEEWLIQQYEDQKINASEACQMLESAISITPESEGS